MKGRTLFDLEGTALAPGRPFPHFGPNSISDFGGALDLVSRCPLGAMFHDMFVYWSDLDGMFHDMFVH